MKEIKFRGKTLKGKTVYGGLIEQYPNRRFIYDMIDIDVATGNFGTIVEVEPESVAQLVGYDKDGVEVYEGDSFDVKFSNEDETRHYMAELLPQATDENGCIFYDYHFKRNSITELNHRD